MKQFIKARVGGAFTALFIISWALGAAALAAGVSVDIDEPMPPAAAVSANFAAPHMDGEAGAPPPAVTPPSAGPSEEGGEKEKKDSQDKEDKNPSSNLVVVGYKVLRGKSAVSRVQKGDKVTIQLYLKNTAVMTSEVGGAAGLDVTKPMDSFSFHGKPEVKVTSKGDEPLAFTVTLQSLVYSGSGNTLNLIVAYPGLSISYDTVEASILEAKESGAGEESSLSSTPMLNITRDNIDKPIEPGQKFSVKVTFHNISYDEDLEHIVATFTPSEGFMLLGKTANRVIGDLETRKAKTIILQLQALEEIPTANQSLNVEVKYDVAASGGSVASSATERILIPAKGKSALSAATPNIIVSQYSYGDRVAAGSEFPLSISFRNTSKTLPVENIVLTLDTGEGLSITSSSNTFYIERLGPGEVKSQTVLVQALTAVKSENQSSSPKVELSFKYEFVDSEKRSQASANEKIAIPVYQPDRFAISPPTLPDTVRQNEELTVSLPYVNKGKSEVSNVEALLVGNIESLSAHQNLGNFEPGKSGTIDFIVTPRQSGGQKFTVKVAYEDANQKLKTMEFPVSLQVEEAPEMDVGGMGEDMQYEDGSAFPWWALAAPAVLAAFGAVLLRLYRRKRSQAPPEPAEEFVWMDDLEPLALPRSKQSTEAAGHDSE